jgi:sigma-E factor negative regulatory protein RseC
MGSNSDSILLIQEQRMITEQAVVTRRQGNRVEVRLQRQSACGHCELSQGCGTGALGRLLGNRSRPLIVETGLSVNPGDRLELSLSESALVKASLAVYGLPLLGMLLLGLFAALGGLREAYIILASAAGFFAGFKVSSVISKTLEADRLTPYIVDIRVNPESLSGS